MSTHIEKTKRALEHYHHTISMTLSLPKGSIVFVDEHDGMNAGLPTAMLRSVLREIGLVAVLSLLDT